MGAVVCKFQGSLYVGNFARVVICWLRAVLVLYAYDMVMFALMNECRRVWC